jgi:hypothetical protein
LRLIPILFLQLFHIPVPVEQEGMMVLVPDSLARSVAVVPTVVLRARSVAVVPTVVLRARSATVVPTVVLRARSVVVEWLVY